MIRISCTNCKTVLSIDDAFAGGVCRCQHCGTIQTVPAQARDAAAVGVSGQSMGGSKSLYQQGDSKVGTGLDDLASVVVSSGLSSSRLTRPSGKSSGQGGKQNPLLMPLIAAGGVLIAVLIVIIIYLATRSAAPAPGTAGGNGDSSVNQTAGNTPAPAVNSPNFCGTKLDGNTVIYLLDCGDSTKDYFGELKDATIKSIQSLGKDAKFQILFWNNGSEGAYPSSGTTYASPESITSAANTIKDVFASGQTDIKAALTKAIAEQPDEIVVATGKGWQLELDTGWLDEVMSVRGSSTARIITYSIGSTDKCEPLRRLAEKTGGSYHEVSKSELASFGQ